jgi:copper oxidase (laccase) domain-containing protein
LRRLAGISVSPERLRQIVEREGQRVARLRLEHGARTLVVREPGLYGPADGLVTECDDLILWFTVADCFPLTISARGWRAPAIRGCRCASRRRPGPPRGGAGRV